jgi:hypothetical protein
MKRINIVLSLVALSVFVVTLGTATAGKQELRLIQPSDLEWGLPDCRKDQVAQVGSTAVLP